MNAKEILSKDWEGDEVTFAGYTGTITIAEYGDKLRRAVIKLDPHVATATVNLPGVLLEDDEVIIKSWSENEGMFEMLRDIGMLTFVRMEPTGYVNAVVARVNRNSEPRDKDDEVDVLEQARQHARVAHNQALMDHYAEESKRDA